jgi:cob(I)alamin adenosyltransferase
MIEHMKIYTRTGDDGTTGLIGGSRVRKDDPRIDCTGTIDELNAAIGLAGVTAAPELLEQLRQVQNDLFVIGSHLATPADSPHRSSLPPLDPQVVSRLETEIDAADAQLPPLRNFILPGGSETAARLHLTRAVCRRVERVLVGHAGLSIPTVVLSYFNRFSDWLFVQARRANQLAGVADIPWRAK